MRERLGRSGGGGGGEGGERRRRTKAGEAIDVPNEDIKGKANAFTVRDAMERRAEISEAEVEHLPRPEDTEAWARNHQQSASIEDASDTATLPVGETTGEEPAPNEPATLNAGVSMTPSVAGEAEESQADDTSTAPVSITDADDRFDDSAFNNPFLDEINSQDLKGSQYGGVRVHEDDEYTPERNVLDASAVGAVLEPDPEPHVVPPSSDIGVASLVDNDAAAAAVDIPAPAAAPRETPRPRSPRRSEGSSTVIGSWVPTADRERADALSGRDAPRKGFTTPVEAVRRRAGRPAADRVEPRRDETPPAGDAAVDPTPEPVVVRDDADRPVDSPADPGGDRPDDAAALEEVRRLRRERKAAAKAARLAALAAAAEAARTEAAARTDSPPSDAAAGRRREKGTGGGGRGRGGEGDGSGRGERPPHNPDGGGSGGAERGPKQPKGKQQPQGKGQEKKKAEKVVAAGPYPAFGSPGTKDLLIAGAAGAGILTYAYWAVKFTLLKTTFESVTGAFGKLWGGLQKALKDVPGFAGKKK